MKTITFFLTLFSFSTFAAAPVKVPAKNLLEAARSIIAQTSPAYFVKGKIACRVLHTGWAPRTSSCDISINGSTSSVSKPDAIIAALQKKRPALGPAWEVRGTFEASSISPQIPPFTPNEQASITLK